MSILSPLPRNTLPQPSLTPEEISALKNCVGEPLTEEEQRWTAESIVDVTVIPGGIDFRLRNGEVRPGANLEGGWSLGMAILRGVIASMRQRGGYPMEECRESLRQLLAEIATAETLDQSTF